MQSIGTVNTVARLAIGGPGILGESSVPGSLQGFGGINQRRGCFLPTIGITLRRIILWQYRDVFHKLGKVFLGGSAFDNPLMNRILPFINRLHDLLDRIFGIIGSSGNREPGNQNQNNNRANDMF